MSVSVSAEWTCDWCRTRREGYYGADKPPDSWHRVQLPGSRPPHSSERHLCQSCWWAFDKALPDYDKVVENYWWTQMTKVPRAVDAKPESAADY